MASLHILTDRQADVTLPIIFPIDIRGDEFRHALEVLLFEECRSRISSYGGIIESWTLAAAVERCLKKLGLNFDALYAELFTVMDKWEHWTELRPPYRIS